MKRFDYTATKLFVLVLLVRIVASWIPVNIVWYDESILTTLTQVLLYCCMVENVIHYAIYLFKTDAATARIRYPIGKTCLAVVGLGAIYSLLHNIYSFELSWMEDGQTFVFIFGALFVGTLLEIGIHYVKYLYTHLAKAWRSMREGMAARKAN